MSKYLSWTSCSLEAAKATGARLFLDENAELVYSFQTGSITAYSIAGHDPASLGVPSAVYSALSVLYPRSWSHGHIKHSYQLLSGHQLDSYVRSSCSCLRSLAIRVLRKCP